MKILNLDTRLLRISSSPSSFAVEHYFREDSSSSYLLVGNSKFFCVVVGFKSLTKLVREHLGTAVLTIQVLFFSRVGLQKTSESGAVVSGERWTDLWMGIWVQVVKRGMITDTCSKGEPFTLGGGRSRIHGCE